MKNKEEIKNAIKYIGYNALKGVGVSLAIHGVQRLVSNLFFKDKTKFDDLKKDAIKQVTENIVNSIMNDKDNNQGNRLSLYETHLLSFFYPYKKNRLSYDDYENLNEYCATFPAIYIPFIKTSLISFIKKNNFKIESLFSVDSKDHLVPMRVNKVDMGDGLIVESTDEGVILLFDNEKRKIAIRTYIDKGNYGNKTGGIELTFYTEKKVSTSKNLFDRFNLFMKKYNYLKGRALDDKGEVIYSENFADFDKIFIESKIKELICTHTTEYIKNIYLLKEKGIRSNRGVLLYGPPGTGKTLISKAIAKNIKGKASFISVSCAQLIDRYGNSVEKIFELARWLAPTVILLDDVDKISLGINSLLYEMDGLKGNDGILVIATSNDIGILGAAIADRPSRFDLVLEVPCPNEEIRKEYFILKIKDEDIVNKVVEITDGLTMAHCAEVIERTKIEEVLSNKPFNENIVEVAKNIKNYHTFYQNEEEKVPNRKTLLKRAKFVPGAIEEYTPEDKMLKDIFGEEND